MLRVCGQQAQGVTGLPNPIGDPFAIDFLATRWASMGGNHTFNGTSGNCAGGNRSGGSAYEPGSGITIMAYAGICSNQNLANFSIDTFHVKSLEAIVAYSQTGQGNTCAATTASGNTPPTVAGPGNFNIPKQTPFILTATGSDPDAGDSLTFDWQEYDLGPGTNAVPNTDADGFRNRSAGVPADRKPRATFPRLTHILNNNIYLRQPPRLPDGRAASSDRRLMTFQVFARDNHAGAGGINTATSLLQVDGNSGPFAVTSPNTAVTYASGSTQTVTWDVANTTTHPSMRQM